MQRAVKRVLSDRFPDLVYRQNVKLRSDGRVLTDVDFIIADPARGVLVLCQFKAQELYGPDIRAKGTRTGRLNKEIARWLGSVRDWIGHAEQSQIRATFRLDKAFVVNQVFYLTIARHYAHSLKSVVTGENAAFATWLQFVNAIELMRQHQGDFRTLAGLCRMLIKQNSEVPEGYHVEEDDTAFKLTTVEFAVRRVASQWPADQAPLMPV